MAKEDKLKALDAAISQIEKQYGKGSIMKLGDNSAHMNVETIPTGSLSLDYTVGLVNQFFDASKYVSDYNAKRFSLSKAQFEPL